MFSQGEKHTDIDLKKKKYINITKGIERPEHCGTGWLKLLMKNEGGVSSKQLAKCAFSHSCDFS